MDSASVKDWLMGFDEIISGENDLPIVVIAPGFIHIPLLVGFASKHESVELSAQDLSVYEKGAHTGSVGGFQISDYCKFVIVGHSELAEHRDTVLRKSGVAVSQGLVPIICFKNPSDLDEYYAENTILTWEDPENISKGGEFKPKSTGEIEKVISSMKTKSPNSILLYGGSVNRQNAGELGNITGLDGVLVGSASLDPEHFFEIVKAFEDR